MALNNALKDKFDNAIRAAFSEYVSTFSQEQDALNVFIEVSREWSKTNDLVEKLENDEKYSPTSLDMKEAWDRLDVLTVRDDDAREEMNETSLAAENAGQKLSYSMSEAENAYMNSLE